MKDAHNLCTANGSTIDIKENHTRWSIVILEKLTGPTQIKKFNALYYIIKTNPPIEPTICQINPFQTPISLL